MFGRHEKKHKIVLFTIIVVYIVPSLLSLTMWQKYCTRRGAERFADFKKEGREKYTELTKLLFPIDLDQAWFLLLNVFLFFLNMCFIFVYFTFEAPVKSSCAHSSSVTFRKSSFLLYSVRFQRAWKWVGPNKQNQNLSVFGCWNGSCYYEIPLWGSVTRRWCGRDTSGLTQLVLIPTLSCPCGSFVTKSFLAIYPFHFQCLFVQLRIFH